MTWHWTRTVGAREFSHSPAPGHLYTCHRVSDRSKKYFAKYNGGHLPGSQGKRVFWGPLEKCQVECERHFAKLMEKKDG